MNDNANSRNFHRHSAGGRAFNTTYIKDVDEACNHKKEKLGYIQWHAWADENMKRGIKQIQCSKCKLWLFPEER